MPSLKLNYARQDANDLADELEKDYGFKSENVHRLIDKDATIENIRHEINAPALFLKAPFDELPHGRIVFDYEDFHSGGLDFIR